MKTIREYFRKQASRDLAREPLLPNSTPSYGATTATIGYPQGAPALELGPLARLSTSGAQPVVAPWAAFPEPIRDLHQRFNRMPALWRRVTECVNDRSSALSETPGYPFRPMPPEPAAQVNREIARRLRLIDALLRPAKEQLDTLKAAKGDWMQLVNFHVEHGDGRSFSAEDRAFLRACMDYFNADAQGKNEKRAALMEIGNKCRFATFGILDDSDGARSWRTFCRYGAQADDSLSDARDSIALKVLPQILGHYQVPDNDAVSGQDDKAAVAPQPVLAAREDPYQPMIGWQDGQSLVDTLSRLYDAEYIAFTQLQPLSSSWTPEYRSAQEAVKTFLSESRPASSRAEAPQPIPPLPEAVRQRLSLLRLLKVRSEMHGLEVGEIERVDPRAALDHTPERKLAKDRMNLVRRQIDDFVFKCEHLWKPVVYLGARAGFGGAKAQFLDGCEKYFATDDPGLRKKIGGTLLLALSKMERTSGSHNAAINWDIFNETHNDALLAGSLRSIRHAIEHELRGELLDAYC